MKVIRKWVFALGSQEIPNHLVSDSRAFFYSRWKKIACTLWQLLDMEQQEAVDRRCLEKCIRERDSLKAALEEEHQLRESDDEEMRRKLKVVCTLKTKSGGFCCF